MASGRLYEAKIYDIPKFYRVVCFTNYRHVLINKGNRYRLYDFKEKFVSEFTCEKYIIGYKSVVDKYYTETGEWI